MSPVPIRGPISDFYSISIFTTASISNDFKWVKFRVSKSMGGDDSLNQPVDRKAVSVLPLRTKRRYGTASETVRSAAIASIQDTLAFSLFCLREAIVCV
jgi:hypothetical protein